MQRGFTIIELIIVIVIVGSLASVVLPLISRSFSGAEYVRTPSNAVLADSVSCSNGILMKNGQPIVQNGTAVKC